VSAGAITALVLLYLTGAALVPCAYFDESNEIILAAALLWPLVVLRWIVRGAMGLWRL